MSDSTLNFPVAPGDEHAVPPPVEEAKTPEGALIERKARPEVPIQRRLLFIGTGVLIAAGFAGLALVRHAAEAQQADSTAPKTTGSVMFAPKRDISAGDAGVEFNSVNQPKTQASTAGDGSKNEALAKFQHDFPFVKPPDYLLNGGQQQNGQAGQASTQTGATQSPGMAPFQRSFMPAGNGGSTQMGAFSANGEERESDAQMYRRLEREARLAGTRVDFSKKGDGQPSTSATSAATPQGTPTSSLANGYAGSTGSDLRELGQIAKELVAAQGGTPQSSQPSHLSAPGTMPTNPGPASTQTSSSYPMDDVVKRMQGDVMKTWRTGPLSPYEIKAGWDIPCELKQEMDTEAPGIVSCSVRHNVKDTRTGSYILIPAGSTMIGTYKPATSGNAGIQAVEAIFTRIIFPDTSSMDLDAIVAQDNKGEAGIRGKANNHYKAIISAAVLQTLVSTGSALLLNRTGGAAAGGLGYYPSASQAAEAGAANSVNEVGSQFTKRAMNIPVTIHVNAGTVINFELDRDLQFEGPYKDRKPLMSAVQ